MEDGGIFKMWYAGVSVQGRQLFIQIGCATSSDGRSWKKYGGNPVLSVAQNNGILTPSVIQEKPYFELWHTMFNEATGLPASPIRQAISGHGVDWILVPENALVKGPQPAWDWWAVFGPTVMPDDGVYKMRYSGTSIDPSGVHLTSGHANAAR